MINNLFYCPKCNKEEDNIDTKPLVKTWTNPRDGYGAMIHHVLCPNCGFELSGYVIITHDFDEGAKFYYKDTISGYSDGTYIDKEDVEKLIKEIRKDLENRRK